MKPIAISVLVISTVTSTAVQAFGYSQWDIEYCQVAADWAVLGYKDHRDGGMLSSALKSSIHEKNPDTRKRIDKLIERGYKGEYGSSVMEVEHNAYTACLRRVSEQ